VSPGFSRKRKYETYQKKNYWEKRSSLFFSTASNKEKQLSLSLTKRPKAIFPGKPFQPSLIFADIRVTRKSFPETNTLAYFVPTSVTTKEVFVASIPGTNVIKIFTTVSDEFL
jgi:hypothetical protein